MPLRSYSHTGGARTRGVLLRRSETRYDSECTIGSRSETRTLFCFLSHRLFRFSPLPGKPIAPHHGTSSNRPGAGKPHPFRVAGILRYTMSYSPPLAPLRVSTLQTPKIASTGIHWQSSAPVSERVPYIDHHCVPRKVGQGHAGQTRSTKGKWSSFEQGSRKCQLPIFPESPIGGSGCTDWR